ncbi:helix-turn-helix domain-containing protein [Arthrobacter tumbae]|uniref:helix-turn-helix domain-containing protein n=1 Tax=Arthrobacter tumbae TaxID=163874 RepID=UPI0019596180|nr:helix-turn-helix domain-containing protein [Arthrobacter tumbae]MBM7780456.1 transposase [Arthrobacter tumbae]
MSGNDRNARLSRKQEAALAALAVVGSTKEAAERVGVAESTVRRWFASEPFREAYRQQSRELNGEALDDLRMAQKEAVRVLRAGLSAESPATQVRAASRLLEVGLKIRDDDIEARLADLERRAEP